MEGNIIGSGSGPSRPFLPSSSPPHRDIHYYLLLHFFYGSLVHMHSRQAYPYIGAILEFYLGGTDGGVVEHSSYGGI